ncbi:hypothetical protein BH11PLA2_BH11PLA2_40150 [soil metagenome]
MACGNRERAEQWRRRLEGWRSSGLSLHAYAREQNLNYLSLRYWHRKLDPQPVAEAASVAAFVPLMLAAEPMVEISLAGGVVLKVPLTATAEQVQCWLMAARAASC